VWPRLLAAAAGILILATFLSTLRQKLPPMLPDLMPDRNVVTPIADPLFHQYLLAFEITSVVLLAAIIGAVALAKRQS
jgi:NADH-quinone oxidoreductase subunit J